MAGRQLTQTQELEKLEQSITLTLQEIDTNFSRAHRIISTSILPIIEQYGEHSKAVWEASQFWKQFFEASANITMEPNRGDEADYTPPTMDDGESSIMRDVSAPSPNGEEAPIDGEDYEHEGDYVEQDEQRGYQEESALDDPYGELAEGTPRISAAMRQSAYTEARPTYDTPSGRSQGQQRDEQEVSQIFSDDDIPLPSSAVRDRPAPQEEAHEDSSIAFEERTARFYNSVTPAGKGKQAETASHYLKKSFRLPESPGCFVARMRSPVKGGPSGVSQSRSAGGTTGRTTGSRNEPADEMLSSSPEILMPKIRSQAFMSPLRTEAIRSKLEAVPSAHGPRTPGVSILGGRGISGASTGARYNPSDDPFTVQKTDTQKGNDNYEINWSSDGEGDPSPPKTIRFSMGPDRVVQTPAREATRRIIEDIVATAGGQLSDDDESLGQITMRTNFNDDGF